MPAVTIETEAEKRLQSNRISEKRVAVLFSVCALTDKSFVFFYYKGCTAKYIIVYNSILYKV